MELRKNFEILQFEYNIFNGQATYLLACNEQTYEQYVAPMAQQCFAVSGRTHPFAVHFVLWSQIIAERGVQNDKTARRTMMLEEKLLRGSSTVTYETPDETKHQLQVLHGLFIDLFLGTNQNKKTLSNIQNLLRNLERVKGFQGSVDGAYVIDEYSHQRLVDGFRSLEDFCKERANRLAARQQRVQNLVGLVSCRIEPYIDALLLITDPDLQPLSQSRQQGQHRHRR